MTGLYERGGERLTEWQVGDGDIIEDDVEVFGPVHQVSADEQRDLLTLSNQLRGVEFGHNAL